jgi:hypothetical protein
MPARELPVCPNLDQLHHLAKDLLRALHAGDADALADLKQISHETSRSREGKATRLANRLTKIAAELRKLGPE